MFVGVARITLQIPESGSLKAKRQVLRRVTERVKAKFNAAVAEVDENDTWNRAVVGIAVVGNERRFAREQLDRILRFVEEIYVAPVTHVQTEVVSFGDTLYGDKDKEYADKDADAEADAEGDLIEQLMPKGERSLAEAEGMGDWEDRPVAHAHPSHPSPPKGKPAVNLEEAKKRARALRNPREWEK